MCKFWSGIGQNADKSPRGRSLQPWDSHVIRADLSIITRYVAIPASKQPFQRRLPQAAERLGVLPQVGQISLPQNAKLVDTRWTS
jgi:hypothetical protein